MKKCSLFLVLSMFILFVINAQHHLFVTSPDQKLKVEFEMSKNGQILYSLIYNNEQVMSASKLGLIREDADFSQNLTLLSISNVEIIADSYTMLHGKRKDCKYDANKKTIFLKNSKGEHFDIVFQVSNNGVAFRYSFPDSSKDIKKISGEISSFHFLKSTKAFLQHCPDSKTGWEQTQPSYEEYYEKGIDVGTPSPTTAGWIFPALFNCKSIWIAISEAGLERNYCGARLSKDSPEGEYTILFPQATENLPTKANYPESILPWYTPWRIIAIGDNLASISESTLGTDLATPAKYDVSSWLKPGKASWSWVIKKDDSTTYNVQKRYIDFAAKMKWDYTLIDADWNIKIGYDSIKILSEYASSKNVGLLLWYNSAGNWNTVKYQPSNMLLTSELRNKEFLKIQSMGIKGIKVDFFGGDGQSMIAYYQDILEDAAKYKLAVNFHGCTLPRGWSRTYPNLVSMEAIRGEEFVTFEQRNADEQPTHCAMLPFTRNLFDPMDFTPVNFSGIPFIKRKTSGAFELALSILFLSGMQHYAETPEGMAIQPDYVRECMANIPKTWDDIKFIDGYPGKFVVIARRSGNQWYIAGINAEEGAKNIKLNLSFLNDKKLVNIISDKDESTFDNISFNLSDDKTIDLKMIGRGGFLIFTK